jgi:hypothetical protein
MAAYHAMIAAEWLRTLNTNEWPVERTNQWQKKQEKRGQIGNK